MKNKILRHISLAIISCVSVVSCCFTEPVTSESTNSSIIETIPNFFDKNVVLATGINFNTGESVVLNPVTGETLNPLTDSEGKLCNPDNTIIYENNNQKSTPQTRAFDRSILKQNQARKLNECDTQIINPSQELVDAIKISNQIVSGTIRTGGKDVPARFVVSVTALYEGSNCAYYISGGTQYRFCSDTLANCNLVAPVINPNSPRYAGSGNESYRRAVRKVCRQFTAWKNNDCNYLRTKYKTMKAGIPPANYSNRYKQYIWKTCRYLAPTWGACPPPESPNQAVSECINPAVAP